MQKIYTRCLRCNRKLRSEESKLLGYGKTCWEKFNAEDNFKELFPESCLTPTLPQYNVPMPDYSRGENNA